MKSMGPMFVALLRAARSLGVPKIWGYLLTPALVSLAVWILVAVFWLGDVIQWLVSSFPLSVLVGWGWAPVAGFFAAIGGWLAVLAFAYLTATLLAALLVLPWLLKHVAARDYPQLAALGSDSTVGATLNTLKATAIFIAGWVLTLPLWLVPGLGLVLPVLWLAYLNRATFAYDALAVHATDAEWKTIRSRDGGGLFGVGLLAALLAHVPIVGLLVPTLVALMYVHYCLDALARTRGVVRDEVGGAGGVVIDGEVIAARGGQPE